MEPKQREALILISKKMSRAADDFGHDLMETDTDDDKAVSSMKILADSFGDLLYEFQRYLNTPTPPAEDAAQDRIDDEIRIGKLEGALKVANKNTQRRGERIEALETALRDIEPLSDVGNLFDGHDELNEETHEANAAHMESALDRINEIARRARED